MRASPRGGFVLYDWGDASFREFSASGDLVWETGGRGEGPGEFARPLDYEFDADGNLMVVDESNVRLTVLDPNGDVVATDRVESARQILPTGFVPDGWAVMPVLKGDSLWVSRGGAPRSVLSPFGDLERIVTESWAANLKSGGVVVVYRWSSHIVWLRPDGSIRGVTQAVEPIPFPEPVWLNETVPGVGRFRGTKVDPNAIELTQSQPAYDAERIYMRALGRTEHSRKVVDTYAIATGEYLGSYRLPHAVSSIAVLEDGRLVTLEVNLIPTVRIWRIE
ncbi:MAG: hypothetical protein J4G03_08125 [Gemmatimonadetes bacterium]|nr:hypothetical protein [Gemmatimonadota bacterium]